MWKSSSHEEKFGGVKRSRTWTSSEDALLKVGVERYGSMDWRRVSASMLNHRRSRTECKERYLELVEAKWTKNEDSRLRELVESFKWNVQWTTVATIMQRPFNSCKSRYDYLLMNLGGDLMPGSSSGKTSGSKKKKQLKDDKEESGVTAARRKKLRIVIE